MKTNAQLRMQDTAATVGAADGLVVAAFARVRPLALGLSVGLVGGLGLFVATATLLLTASAEASELVTGAHLSLLAHFFPGYAVSWPGALGGFAYGAASGFMLGVLLGGLLNLSHMAYVRVVKRRLTGGVMHDAL